MRQYCYKLKKYSRDYLVAKFTFEPKILLYHEKKYFYSYCPAVIICKC